MKTIVKLGNAFDTDGCSVVEGILIKQQKTLLCTNDLILTPRGIVAAGKVVGGQPVEFHYSTMCMPIPEYNAWIERNWDIVVTDEMLAQQKELKVLEEGMKSDKMAITKAQDAIRALNVFSPSEYMQAKLSTKRPDWAVSVANKLPSELHRLGFFDLKASWLDGELRIDTAGTTRMVEYGGQDETLTEFFKSHADGQVFDVHLQHGLREARIEFTIEDVPMLFVIGL